MMLGGEGDEGGGRQSRLGWCGSGLLVCCSLAFVCCFLRNCYFVVCVIYRFVITMSTTLLS